MSTAGESFTKVFGKPDPAAPNGIDYRIWNKVLYAEIGAGWFNDGFLYLFGEGMQFMQQCLDAWSFLVHPCDDRMIVGRNAYGALLVLDNKNTPTHERMWILDPFTVTFATNDTLDFVSTIARALPRGELAAFVDDRAYRQWRLENDVERLGLDDVLGIMVPKALGGELTSSNLQLDGIVDYYRTTASIYAKAFSSLTPSPAADDHRPIATPVMVDHTTLTEATDFDALALEALRGGGGWGSLPSDNFPLDIVFRIYHELQQTSPPFAQRLARGVASCLTADDPEVRAQAIVFFDNTPDAAGGERINDLVAGDRTLFAGVTNPMSRRTDLHQALLAALARRIERGDQRALDLARDEVVLPGRGGALVGAMVEHATDWVIARAEDIVRASPTAGATLLIRLQDNSGYDLAGIARRIARWCHSDPRFELDITRFIEDPTVRQEILDAFHTTARD